MARVVGLKVVAMVVLASVASESWVLAPLYHIERPVHVSAVALCDAWCARRAAAGGGARLRARCMGACRFQHWRRFGK